MSVSNFSKNVLSYLSGSLVEKRKSTVSGELEVWFQNGKYVLHSPDANYSFDTLHRVFQKAFTRFKIRTLNPGNALILGFGAGSVATILVDELSLNPDITGVEFDAEVIALARKYFAIDRFKKLRILEQDASEFVKSCNSQFDLVINDVFVNKNVPDKFLTGEYAHRLVELTTKSGTGMMNVITETENFQKKVESIRQSLSLGKNFDIALYQPTPINSILAWSGKPV